MPFPSDTNITIYFENIRVLPELFSTQFPTFCAQKKGLHKRMSVQAIEFIYIRRLKLSVARRAGKRYHITNIRHTRNEQQQPLKP